MERAGCPLRAVTLCRLSLAFSPQVFLAEVQVRRCPQDSCGPEH